MISTIDKRIIILYYLEHCELKDVTFERFDPQSYDTRLSALLKTWTSQNMYYNSLEKTINLPNYLENNYLSDFGNQEFEMVIYVRSV